MDLLVHKQNTILLDSYDVSLGNVTSNPVALQQYSLFCIQTYWTNYTPGTDDLIIVEGSNEINKAEVDRRYEQLSASIPTSGDAGVLLNYEKAGFALVRVRFETSVAGTGTITSILNGKVI